MKVCRGTAGIVTFCLYMSSMSVSYTNSRACHQIIVDKETISMGYVASERGINGGGVQMMSLGNIRGGTNSKGQIRRPGECATCVCARILCHMCVC